MGTARGGCLAVTRVRIGPGLSPTVMCLGMEWDGMRVGRTGAGVGTGKGLGMRQDRNQDGVRDGDGDRTRMKQGQGSGQRWR